MQMIKTNYLLLLILILGTYLRFYTINFNSFWLDELFSMDFSNPSRSLLEVIQITLKDVHPPLYQILLWVWLKLFGYTEFAARSLSAVIGIFVILVSYIFTKELFNKNIGLVVAFIVSTNLYIIFFSQETRSYQLVLLLSMLSYLYFYKSIIYKSKKDIFLYWLVTVLWIYTNYFSLIFITTQAIFALIYYYFYESNKNKLLKLIIYTTIFFLITLIPLSQYIFTSTQGNKFYWIAEPTLLYFVQYISYYFMDGGIYFVLFGILITIYYMLTEKLIQKEKIVLSMIFVFTIFGFLLPYVLSLIFYPIVISRYTMVLIPFIILISIYGVMKFNKVMKIILLFIYMLFMIKVLYFNFYQKPYKQQYKEALLSIEPYQMVPIYELIPENGHNGNNTNHFQVYSNILDKNMKILDDTQFIFDRDNNRLPQCFWAVYTFYSPTLQSLDDISEMYLINKNDFLKIVYKNTFYGAETILIANKVESKKCLNQVKLGQ